MFVYLYVYICVHENFLYLSLQCLVVFDILLTIKFFTFFYCYDYDNKLYSHLIDKKTNFYKFSSIYLRIHWRLIFGNVIRCFALWLFILLKQNCSMTMGNGYKHFHHFTHRAVFFPFVMHFVAKFSDFLRHATAAVDLAWWHGLVLRVHKAPSK